MAGIGLRCAQGLGILWTLPMTLAGLLAGLAALPFGARMRYSDAAVIFLHYPWGPGGALTLGNTILFSGHSLDQPALTYQCRAHGGQDRVRIGDHERAHVYQYLALGLFFLPMYFLCGGISHGNRFEQAADRYARCGRGWWPWPRPTPDER